ncbi:hypothetical protein [Sphingobacterium pedocola]|uniref:hypothetical protein n=1 Tax=Sphingobacterium pedocola TaxID=2082722 RepID=UPI0018CAFB80|nr:hypothetical protein [Sphingobacterium pedocola]
MARLSEGVVNNNNQVSSWWMRDGTFLRLKNVELGYTFSRNVMERIGARNLRVYVNGMNLFAFSKFKLWDVEMGRNGIGYPVQAVYNLGIKFTF